MSEDIKFNGGYNNCNDRMNILKNSVVQRRLDKFEELDTSKHISENASLYVDNEGKDCKVSLQGLLNPHRVKSDFAVDDPNDDAYIKNKELVRDIAESYLAEDLTSLYTVGGVQAGEVFEAGTSVLDILKAILSTSRGTAIRFGVFNSIPEDVEVIPEFEKSVSDLIINGFEVKDMILNNQYFVLAVPNSANLIVSSIEQGGFSIGFKHKHLGNAWELYYDDLPATGTYTIKYNFKEGSYND